MHINKFVTDHQSYTLSRGSSTSFVYIILKIQVITTNLQQILESFH